MTLRKSINAARLWTSYQRTRYSLRPVHIGSPMTLSIEPTTACNLRCPECPSGLRAFSRPTGNLKEDFFRRVVDEMHRELIYLIFYFQGEPFINPDFLKMVRYASDRDIYTITSTNGHFLHDEISKATVESGLDRLIISIDGTTQDVYEQYRKEGNLQKVIDGTKNILEWRKKLGVHHPHVVFQFLVVGANEHQIDDVAHLAEKLGVDEVKYKTAQIYDYQKGHSLIPSDMRYSRYVQREDGQWHLKYKIRNECWKMWHSAVITWDGRVVPCCFDKDAAHEMGSLNAQSFKEIWEGPAYSSFRTSLFADRTKIDICTNCTEGCKVWA